MQQLVEPLSRGARKWIIVLLTLVALLELLGLVQIGKWLGSFVPSLAAPQINPGTVVMQLHKATDLSTLVYTTETIVPVSQNRLVGSLSVGSTSLLYIAKGEIRAGIDFNQIETKDINIDHGAITVVLPSPHLIDRKIDVERSRIYESRRDWFGPETEATLHQQAEQDALKNITIAACREGILQEASDRAEVMVTRLLQKAGYREVTVTTRPFDRSTCSAT